MIKLTRSSHRFHSFVLILSLLFLGYGIWHFWKKGPANIENVTMVFEASSNLEKVKNNNDIKYAKLQVGNDRSREAIKTIMRLERDVKKLNFLTGEEEVSEKLDNYIKLTKKSLDEMITLPSLSSVLNVLYSRIQSFERFVSSNRWRTLTRISKRISAELKPVRLRKPGVLNQRKISNLVRTINRDLALMEKVTSSSVLQNSEKDLIIARIQTLKTEVVMLKKYLKGLSGFHKNFKGLELSFATWLKKTEPEISLQLIKFENNSKIMLFALGGLFLLLMAGLGLGFVIIKKEDKERKKRIEGFTIDAIKDAIIPVQAKNIQGGSREFYDEIDKYRGYVHKRMSFGTLFRDSLPFSSLILDSNLHVVWANKDFYNSFGIEVDEDRENNINWDFLNQFTNLGENDPVVSALNENISGIYQIQISGHEKKESLPYEMYVTPVEYAGQSRIVIFFYPLKSVEETLSHQMRSVVGPVSRTLEAMSEENFNPEFKEKIKKDFEIAGISELYDKFENYHENISADRDSYLIEIEKLENELFDQYKAIDDIKLRLGEGFRNFKKGQDSISEVRNQVINQVSLRSEITDSYRKTIDTAKSLFREEEQLFESCLKLSSDLSENEQAFGSIVQIKDEFKKIKVEVNDFKMNLVQSLEQSLVLQRVEGMDLRIEQSLNRLKSDIKGFDKILSEFNKRSTQLDVSLSKIGMLLERSSRPDLDIMKVNFVDNKENIEDEMFQVGRLGENGNKVDEETINSLKDFFDDYIVLKDSFKKMALLVDGSTQTRGQAKTIMPGERENELAETSHHNTQSI
ncbi:MAG: hypothetical protein KC493_03455 [Bacteriovoracaceae bacterium]|nr:hypothetical protein [Bacteriovoracaceae bacterium]